MSAHLRLSPFDIYIDPLLDLQDPRLRELLAYWNGKRAGRAIPDRADVSPAEIVSHLPSVFLIGAEPPAVGPSHFHVRLMGTALNELFAADFTGQTLEERLPEKSAAALAKVLGVVCELRRPLRVHGQATIDEAHGPTEVEAVFLPLSLGGARVEMAMGELVKRASA